MSKEERIAAERERLNALFADLDANQLQAAAGLISSAAFLAVSLEDLEADINANGCIDEYTNGANQCGYKVAASVQAYTSLNAKYQSTMNKLLKLVPPAPKPAKEPEKTTAELKAEIEAQQRQRIIDRQRQRDVDFLTAVSNGTATNETYKEFCATWEKEHAND